MISIANLTNKQRLFCDTIWSMPDQTSVIKWFETLSPSDQVVANAMLLMITYELMDEEPITDLSLAMSVIDEIRYRDA